jgi:hypothetical protein
LLYCCSSCTVDLLAVKQNPTLIDTAGVSKPSWILAEPINIKMDVWRNIALKKDTEWIYVGQINEGEIYKTNDQIVMLDGFNAFEANLVLSGNKLMGFYLPVEKTFTPLKYPVLLKIKNSD